MRQSKATTVKPIVDPHENVFSGLENVVIPQDIIVLCAPDPREC